MNVINLENINGAFRDLFLFGQLLRHRHMTLLPSALTETLVAAPISSPGVYLVLKYLLVCLEMS